ncbi:unnamed protein product [Lymnaea stagnalis]|uniref:Uncharacterized protein n=1 Tax=Lymnaea stagnalis TaxID=6523 RepID=A0AAV2IHG2_LYMST
MHAKIFSSKQHSTMASCILITAIICVLIATVAVIVAFATPNWAKFQGSPTKLCGCNDCDCGLWLQCAGGFSDGSIDNCKWYFTDEFRIEKLLPDWFKAVQGLMSCAIASSLIALIIGLFSLCCYCKSCSAHHAAGVFILLTFLLVTSAVCVFGAKGHLDHSMQVIVIDGNASSPYVLYGWSFWVAVSGAGMSLIASFLYLCVGRRDEYV